MSDDINSFRAQLMQPVSNSLETKLECFLPNLVLRYSSCEIKHVFNKHLLSVCVCYLLCAHVLSSWNAEVKYQCHVCP